MLIGERWLDRAERFLDLTNPATGEALCRVPMGGAAEVDAAVQAATAGFEQWRAQPVAKRMTVLFRYRELLDRNAEELARCISRENGKTLDEARGDLRRGIEVVEFACGAPTLAAGEAVGELASGIDSTTWREPIGVCAGITPFNFPAMVPLWMFPIALACGSSFVLKPSEKTPLTAVRLAELLREAGLPAGVFNLVHGGREVVEALCQHPGIAAVSFVGSTPVAEAVYRMGTASGKRVQAAGGAKNCLVVMPDADPDATIRAIMGASFGCAGQRCMAGSIVMGVGAAADGLRERLCAEIDRVAVGDPLGEARADMGPLIDAASRDRVHRGIAAGVAEGAELVRDGRSGVPARGNFVRPTLFDRVQPGSKFAREEWFGPLLSMQRPKDLAEAVAWANAHEYGNGAVIFTGDGGAARRFAREIRCGMVGVNVPVPAALAPYAFSGWNRSFFGDLHVQGREGFQFYTRQKLVLARWDAGYKRTLGW
jgi:malonate-semialdehyde dehydrogenase (acetylating)/methylmalonate-semialdehyde dehydrogenase